jgi:hypothetical protein
MEELERAFTQRAGREPDRLNPVLGLFGRASPDREFYQAVSRRLVELYPLPPNALQELAARRAGTVVEYLAGPASIEPGRLESGAVRSVHAAADEPITMRLGLDVAKPSREAAASRGRPDDTVTTPAPASEARSERVGRGSK